MKLIYIDKDEKYPFYEMKGPRNKECYLEESFKVPDEVWQNIKNTQEFFKQFQKYLRDIRGSL
jgi:hypothetical protein